MVVGLDEEIYKHLKGQGVPVFFKNRQVRSGESAATCVCIATGCCWKAVQVPSAFPDTSHLTLPRGRWTRQIAQVQAGTGNNHAISALKFGIIHEFLELGWSVLLSDVDIVTLQVRALKDAIGSGLRHVWLLFMA